MHFVHLFLSLILINTILCAIGVGRKTNLKENIGDHFFRSWKRSFEPEIQIQQAYNHL